MTSVNEVVRMVLVRPFSAIRWEVPSAKPLGFMSAQFLVSPNS